MKDSDELVLSYAEALAKMIQILQNLNDGSVLLPDMEQLAAELLPNSRLYSYIGNPNRFADPADRAKTIAPIGYIVALVIMPDLDWKLKLNSLLPMIRRLQAFMKVLKSASPLVDAIELYNRLYRSDFPKAYFKSIMDVIMCRLDLEGQNRWLSVTLSKMLFRGSELTPSEAALLQMMVSADPLPRESAGFQTILDFATELSDDGVLHSMWYPQAGAQGEKINLLRWAINLIERNDEVLGDLEVIAKSCGFGVNTWPDYEGFLKAIDGTDWDMILFLIINEFQAYSGNGEVTSLLLSRAAQ